MACVTGMCALTFFFVRRALCNIFPSVVLSHLFFPLFGTSAHLRLHIYSSIPLLTLSFKHITTQLLFNLYKSLSLSQQQPLGNVTAAVLVDSYHVLGEVGNALSYTTSHLIVSQSQKPRSKDIA